MTDNIKSIKMCCMCGFIHSHHDHNYLPSRPYYYWTPSMGIYISPNNIQYQAIVCATCVNVYKQIDWDNFVYHSNNSLDEFPMIAPLPESYMYKLNDIYKFMIKHLQTLTSNSS